MNNAVFGKTMENVKKKRNQTCHSRKKKKLFDVRTKLSYHKVFHRISTGNRNAKENQILMNKLFCLGLPVLELSKRLMWEFCYEYVKPKYGEKIKMFYMDIDSFIVYIKINDVYKDIAEDVETRFDNSNYELDSPFPRRKNEKVIGLMKDKLGGKIVTNICWIKCK